MRLPSVATRAMRARRARTGSSLTTRPIPCARMRGRSRPGDRRARTTRAPAGGSRRSTSRAGSRARREIAQHVGLLGGEAAHAGREDLGEHGIGERGARPPGGDRLDHRVPEAFPGRREHHEIARCVRVGRRSRRGRSSPGPRCDRRGAPTCRRSRLRPVPRSTGAPGDRAGRARGAWRAEPRPARSCARSRATVAASRRSSSVKPSPARGCRRDRRVADRDRRSCEW